jgi:hypothetical protein
MRAGMSMIVLVCAGLAVPAAAQTKTENECLDIVSKHLHVMTDTLKESKPTGACALANWAKNRHEEILRVYSTEPEECRKSELGKKVETTLKARIRQETNMAKRHCRRK